MASCGMVARPIIKAWVAELRSGPQTQGLVEFSGGFLQEGDGLNRARI
jgi:hypothetical protein